MRFREQAAQQIHGCFRRRIEFYFIDFRDFPLMCNNNAVNRSGGGNGNVIDDSVNWIAQKFEAGDERDIEIAARKSRAKRSRMIERDLTRPAADERAGVKIFDATDA